MTLIDASILLSEEDKLRLLDLTPGLNDHQVEALGKFFAAERQYVVENEDDIRQQLDIVLTELEKTGREKVYVGLGKAQ